MCAITYFAIVFGAGFVLGIGRVAVLVPAVGVRAAELIEMPIMFIVIILAAKLVTRRLPPRQHLSHLVTGTFAMLILLIAELVMVMLSQGGEIAQYIQQRDPVSGSVYLAMLILFGLMPWLIAMFSRRAQR